MARQTPAQRWAKDDAAQRARAQKAAAMGPGREDAEDVLADVIAVMDLDTRRLKLKAETGEPLTVGESQTLGNYVRSLASAITARTNAKTKGKEEGLTDAELEEEVKKAAERAAKQAQHAQHQAKERS
jgi:hypothetical protein